MQDHSPSRAGFVLPLSFTLLLTAACQSAAEDTRSLATLDEASPQEAAAGVESLIAEERAWAERAIAAIVAVPDSKRTYENTLLAVDDLGTGFWMKTRMRGFMAQVHPDPEVREHGRQVATEVGEWFVDLYKREDLYRAVRAYADTSPELEGEAARFLEKLLRDYRRAGMDLPAKRRAEVAEIEKELNRLGVEFGQNIADDKGVVFLNPGELEGVPQELLDTLPRSGELYVVRVIRTNLVPILENCTVEATRQKMSVAYGRRAEGNVEVIEEILRLRDRRAELLGYETTAHFETEVRMAENPETVFAFYEDLRPRLRQKAERDYAEFQDAKRQDTGDPSAKLEPWDFTHYRRWLQRERYAVDSEKVREYFELDNTLQGLYAITQKLYGITYKEVTDRAEELGLPLWHEDARVFQVWDDESGEMLGAFYIDLHPRDGKYTHAAQFPLRVRKRWANGELTKPLVALVCNFTKPTDDKPSLLSHREATTLFHEFGHCLHSILTEADLGEFSGTSVARDFVEAPSQMFEEWVWDRETLASFAKHYQTGEPLPDELLQGMVAARFLGEGISKEYQVFLGLMDMRYHTADGGEVDTTQVYLDTYDEARVFDAPRQTFTQASFGHLNGYQAGYYGYLWSLVYAADMFGRFEEHGLLNPKAGRWYRKKILSRGGTVPEMQMIEEYLGREPNSEAFMRLLGLAGS